MKSLESIQIYQENVNAEQINVCRIYEAERNCYLFHADNSRFPPDSKVAIETKNAIQSSSKHNT